MVYKFVADEFGFCKICFDFDFCISPLEFPLSHFYCYSHSLVDFWLILADK